MQRQLRANASLALAGCHGLLERATVLCCQRTVAHVANNNLTQPEWSLAASGRHTQQPLHVAEVECLLHT